MGVAVIWGINIPIMKIGLERVDVFVFNAIRLTVSAAVLWAYAIRERRRGKLPDASITVKQLIVYALLISALYQLAFLLGVRNTTAGNVALIFATTPMWTAVLARMFLGESLRRLAVIGLVITIVGTIIVALQKGDVTADGKHLLGNLFALAAALLWAGGTVYGKPMLSRISPVQLAAWGAVLALPIHIVIASTRFEPSLPALGSVNLWLIILYSGVLSSGLALPMWNYGVRQAGASHAAAVQNLVPVVAILAAWISRGETATFEQVIGGALILGGLVVIRLGREAA